MMKKSLSSILVSLLNALAKIEDLKVAARTSSFSFKGKNVNVDEIGPASRHEIVQTDSVHFIATEFIDGQTLRERMRIAPMKLSEALDVATQIASALSAAHAAGRIASITTDESGNTRQTVN